MQWLSGERVLQYLFFLASWIEEIVGMQTEAIKNIKIDKISVWDSGNSDKGSSTSNFISQFVKSLPALHDIASLAGLELPQYLGKVSPDVVKVESELEYTKK